MTNQTEINAVNFWIKYIINGRFICDIFIPYQSAEFNPVKYSADDVFVSYLPGTPVYILNRDNQIICLIY